MSKERDCEDEETPATSPIEEKLPQLKKLRVTKKDAVKTVASSRGRGRGRG